MANILTNSPSFAVNPAFGAYESLLRAIANWKLYRRTLAELRTLNSRELADLGISRYALNQVARESVYGK